MSGMPPGPDGQYALCDAFTHIGLGSQGDDVKSLQQMLMQDSQSGFTGTTSGFLARSRRRRWMHWQSENGVASSSTGFVGR